VRPAETAEADTAIPTAPTQLVAAAASIPHPAKVEKGGEDAFFVLETKAIGIADGVGSWGRDGVDPAAYSKALMSRTARALMRGRGNMTCVQALEQAQQAVMLPGSSTAIVARCDFSMF
jgi:protein phosphatase PTC7